MKALVSGNYEKRISDGNYNSTHTTYYDARHVTLELSFSEYQLVLHGLEMLSGYIKMHAAAEFVVSQRPLTEMVDTLVNDLDYDKLEKAPGVSKTVTRYV